MFTTFCLNTLICGKNSDIAQTSGGIEAGVKLDVCLNLWKLYKTNWRRHHSTMVKCKYCAQGLYRICLCKYFFHCLQTQKLTKTESKEPKSMKHRHECCTYLLHCRSAPRSELLIFQKKWRLDWFSVISRVVATISCWETLARSNIVQRSWPAHCVWTVWMLAVKGWWATPCVQRAA